MTSETQTPPKPHVAKGSGGSKRSLSLVWIVPLVALVAVLVIAFRAYSDRGPLIEIAFQNAAGVKADSTELRYRDVRVGLVEDVSFSEGLDSVVIGVRVDKEVAPFIDEEAQFWVVRPQVSAQGVSGLNTVLSGVYIEGFWDTDAGEATTRFTGLPDAPLERQGEEGLEITFRASGRASLMENTPILYRGVQVGRVGKPSITEDGASAQAPAVIFEPHDRLISSATRFWDASGFSFSLGPGGAALDFSSVASLVSGGVTFETMVSGGEPVEEGATFVVYPEESAARTSLFSGEDGEVLNVSVVFAENITGLSPEAAVEMGGLKIGEVVSLNGLVDPDQFGDNRVRLVASLAIRPGRLGLDDGSGPEEALDYLRSRVDQGLRARLASASILTSGLKIELVDVENPDPAAITETDEGNIYLPTTDSEIAEVAATAQGVFERINNLPIEELMGSATDLFTAARSLIESEDLRAVPGNLNGLLGDARTVVNSEELQALPTQLSQVLNELETTISEFNEAALVARLSEAVDAASEAASGVTASVEGVPELVDQLNAVAARAGEVEIQALADQLTQLVASADALIASDDTRQLPARLNEALAELSAIMTELREGGVVDNVVSTLDSASNAADTFAEAGRDLPRLIEQARAVMARASATLEGYQAENGLGRDARRALIEVQKAAEAVASLARAIERNPNSLLTGR